MMGVGTTITRQCMLKWKTEGIRWSFRAQHTASLGTSTHVLACQISPHRSMTGNVKMVNNSEVRACTVITISSVRLQPAAQSFRGEDASCAEPAQSFSPCALAMCKLPRMAQQLVSMMCGKIGQLLMGLEIGSAGSRELHSCPGLSEIPDSALTQHHCKSATTAPSQATLQRSCSYLCIALPLARDTAHRWTSLDAIKL